MNPNEYQKAALTKQADQSSISAWVYSEGRMATQLNNAARGIAEEAGECNAVVKRWLEYKKPLDRERGLDEAGDVLWRVAQYLDALGYTMEDAMVANLKKLGVRYKEGFTNEEAADENRDREAEAKAQAGPDEEDGPWAKGWEDRAGKPLPIKWVSVDVEDLRKLQEFKAYVHKRLDYAGVPKEIDDAHLKAGCRIGGRLDWFFQNYIKLQNSNQSGSTTYDGGGTKPTVPTPIPPPTEDDEPKDYNWK